MNSFAEVRKSFHSPKKIARNIYKLRERFKDLLIFFLETQKKLNLDKNLFFKDECNINLNSYFNNNIKMDQMVLKCIE